MRIFIYIIVGIALFWAIMGLFPKRNPEASLSGTPTAADQSYHGQIFDYVMTAVEPGVSYAWKTTSVRGAITADAGYKSKSGSLCRAFREEIETAYAKGQQQGIACKRGGDDGWCRLNKDNAQTCAMETGNFTFNIGGFNFGSLPSVGSVNVNTGDVNVTLPAVNAPNVSMPEAPKTDGIKEWFPNAPKRQGKGSGWLIDWMTR